MHRRVEKEINSINETLFTGEQDKFSISDADDNNLNLNALVCFKNYKLILPIKIILPNEYPFQKPKILIKNYKYLTLLRTDPRLLKLLNFSGCMCCNSILCKGWYPGMKIVDVLEEVYNFMVIKKKIVELIHCNKIIDKYLIYDFRREIASYL